MYRRMLFVGLGGSGGKTLRYLKQDLRTWLVDSAKWPKDRPIPRGFQFLHIDTPTAEDGAEITNIRMLDDSEYVGLIGSGVTLTAVVHGIDNGPNYMDTAGWRVDPTAIHVSIENGAGQYRAVGRTIAVSQAQQLKNGLEGAVNRINSAEAISENKELWNLAGHESTTDVESPLVVVVSSLAGGTGAGLLIDVCDALRMIQPSWGGASIGILYTPEVFSNINPAYTGGVQPNSLAAFSELLNGYYLKGQVAGAAGQLGDGFAGTRQNKFLRSAGLNSGVAQSGPQYPFLVGRKNSANMSYEFDTEVFAAMGSVLSLLCRDVAVQEKIQKMTFENWNSQAEANIGSQDLLVTKGLTAERGKPVFQALGCAKVSVGTRYLRRYASARLAKDAYRWITRYHIDEADGQALEAEGIRDPEDRAREIAKKHLGWFLKVSKLEERGVDCNDITSFLEPQEFQVEVASSTEELKRMIDRGEKMTADDWLEQIRTNVGVVINFLDERIQPMIDRQVELWVEERPETLLAATEESIARYGLLVTAEILRLVKDELIDPATGIAAEMMGPNEREHFAYQSQESQWYGAAQAELSGIRGKFTLGGNDSLSRAAHAAIDGASQRVDARIREIAALVVREFADSVVEPLRTAVSRAWSDVGSQADDVKSWPEWTRDSDSPSGEFSPFRNELTLIEPSQFSKEFVKQLALSMNGNETEHEDHRKSVRLDVISGAFLREAERSEKNRSEVPFAVISRAKWSPTHNLIRNSSQSKMEVEVRLGPQDLRERAELWLKRPGSVLQGFLDQGLGQYTRGTGININVDPDEIRKRQSDFKAKLAAAVERSAPLVELNTQLQTALGIPSDCERSFSQLPFAEPHPLAKDVSATVGMIMKDQVPQGLMMTSDTQTIEVISALPGPQHPVVLSSLLRPIGEKWSNVQTSDPQRISFWSFRQSRLPADSIPVPQGHLAAMIRGWFTAHAFGLLEIPTASPVMIAHWGQNLQPARFPYPMLSSASDNLASGRTEGYLFAALESLGLALVAVCEQSNQSPLNAYNALRDFGLSAPDSNDEPILGYPRPNPLIREWIRSGVIKTSDRRSEQQLREGLSSSMSPNLLGLSTSQERVVALKQHFANLTSWLLGKEQEFLDEVAIDRAKLNYTKRWQSLLYSPDGASQLMRAVGALERSIDKWQE